MGSVSWEFRLGRHEVMGEFLDSFSDRNLFADEKLAELVDQARDVVNGLSADELRQDANLRKYIADEINQKYYSIAIGTPMALNKPKPEAGAFQPQDHPGEDTWQRLRQDDAPDGLPAGGAQRDTHQAERKRHRTQ